MRNTPGLIGTWAALMCASAAFPQATSLWVYPGPDGRLQYQTDSRGNRIMDFSSAGYEAGGVALPAVPIAITIGPVSGDNTSHIQAAINTASQLAPDTNGFRGAVLLGPGTYDLSGTVNITAGGVVLRGSGSGASGSVLNLTGSPHLAISVSGSGSWQTVGAAASITDAYVPSGALSFAVNDASGFQAGDTVLIERPVTAPWVHFMGMDTLVRNGAPQTWIAVGGSIRTDRVIAAISGNRITLDVPMSDSIDATLLNPPGASMVKYTFPGRISQVGIEHLSISAPAADVNISSAQFQAISISNLIDGWVRDVIAHDTDNSTSIGSGTKRITFDKVTVTHSVPFTSTAGPADFSASGTQILFNQCSSTGNDGVWPFVSQSEVTGPVVLLNCSADSRGFAPHQRWATGLLADGCQFPGGASSTQGIAYSDRGTDGSGQGWDAGWAVAWNVTSPFFLVQEPPGVNNWCIGCVGTESTGGAPGGPSRLPNGIYDSLGAPVTPANLYLQQLCDRLGPSAVANIGYAGACNASPAQIVLTENLSRDSQNNVVVNLTIANNGGTTARTTHLTAAEIGSTPALFIPQDPVDVPAGSSVSSVLLFPISAGSPGTHTTLSIGGLYIGGSFNFTSRITLP